MLAIQVTKKLKDKLKVETQADGLDEISPLFSWHAHLFLYKRKNYVIVMNNQSRYNFFLGSLVKKDFMNFDALITEGIRENLLADEFDERDVDIYMQQCDSVDYAPTSLRPIIGQMNDSIKITKLGWEFDGLEPADIDLKALNRKTNEVPFLSLPETYSLDAMKKAMKTLKD
ncbi:DUF6933 domain-containing protein [Lentibacillus sediminis]|uniref:DUF6933 domain-containing protein n=1 Tax=Lentibacillus sediminis TaxID=1940529 RepID=UPI000C1C3C83|nr:hypothetical protein [Lentibacillus sediminis]